MTLRVGDLFIYNQDDHDYIRRGHIVKIVKFKKTGLPVLIDNLTTGEKSCGLGWNDRVFENREFFLPIKKDTAINRKLYPKRITWQGFLVEKDIKKFLQSRNDNVNINTSQTNGETKGEK